jgi:hypothetical protein
MKTISLDDLEIEIDKKNHLIDLCDKKIESLLEEIDNIKYERDCIIQTRKEYLIKKLKVTK